jgi:hypothetical protein
MWQLATPASVSRSRKLVQPFVAQNSLPAVCVLCDRRRSRRIADARPVTVAVADRVIIVCS